MSPEDFEASEKFFCESTNNPDAENASQFSKPDLNSSYLSDVLHISEEPFSYHQKNLNEKDSTDESSKTSLLGGSDAGIVEETSRPDTGGEDSSSDFTEPKSVHETKSLLADGISVENNNQVPPLPEENDKENNSDGDCEGLVETNSLCSHFQHIIEEDEEQTAKTTTPHDSKRGLLAFFLFFI